MLKRSLSILLFLALLLFCMPALADEAAETAADNDFPFRAMPGYTCFPLTADNKETPGHFLLDCPMEWEGGDYSEAYGVPSVMAMESMTRMDHMVLVTEIPLLDQLTIMLDEESQLQGFLSEGLAVTRGESTDGSRIIETFDLHGLPATRVEMVGQGFEMLWILDRYSFLDEYGEGYAGRGDLWFFMYPTDPKDEAYTQTVAEMVDSFTVFFPYSAGEVPASDFEYTVEEENGEKGVHITAYKGDAAYVNVPSEIEGERVTAVGDRAFYETAVRSVTFPDTVQEFGSHMFGGCTELAAVGLPEDLETLPSGTFESCFRLTEPGLNSVLRKIETAAFWGNQYLFTLSIPDSLEEIEDNNFVMCDILAYFDVSEDCVGFRTNEDGTVLLSKDGRKLIRYSFLNEDKRYEVPEGVEEIYSNCFHRSPVEEVILPDSLKSIGYAAFEPTAVTELTIPAGCTEIGVIRYVNDGSGSLTDGYSSISNSIQTIRGVPGSAAEEYAQRFSLTFVPVDEGESEQSH